MSNADRVDAYLSRKNSKSSNATSTTTKTSNADRVDAYLHKRNEEAFSKMRLHNVNGDFRKTGNYKDYGYKTQEAYDADVKKYNWASANQGLTYDEVKKRRQIATGDELNYLNQYGTLVGYNDVKDYDAEIADLTTSGVDWNKLKQKGVEFALGSELTRNLGINVDDSTYRDQLEAKANQMRLNNPLVDYQDIINAEDFAELSANAPVENKDKYGYAKQIAAETLLGRNLAKKLGFDYGSAWDDTLKSKMTDEEIAVYNYLANKQAQEGDSYSGVTADEYMDNIATSLGKRVTDDYTAQAKEFSDSNGNVGSEILAKTLLGWNGASLLDDKAKNDLALTTERIAMQPLALASEAMNLGDTLTTGEYNPYGQYAMLYNAGEANQNIVSQDIADATPNANVLGVNVPSFLYNTGLSTADSAIGAAMFGPAYSFLMGTGAFQSEAKKIIDEGGTQQDVWMKAGAAGITEVVTEYYSLEKLENLVKNKDLDSVGKVLLSTLRQAGYEGSEEVAADVINHLVDEAYNGGLSETSQKIEEYKRLGYSDSEATKMAYKDFAIQVGESFVGGALSGGAMGGAVATNNYISNVNAGANLRANNNLQAIDEAAQNLDRESDAFKNYERITKGSNDISKARDAEISSAYNQINRQLNKQEVENLLTMRGMDYEEAKIASSAVAELMSTNSTEGMSKAEIEALSDDRVVNLVNGILDGRISLQRSDKLGRARQMRTVFQDASSIEQTEDGYVIHNQDGTTETVANDAVSTTEADIMGYVSKYNEEAQNIFLENYRYSGNIGIYDAAFNTVYQMGIDGERLGKNEGRVFGDILGDRNVLNIYKAGMKSVNQRAEASAIAIENALEGFKAENFKSGTFKSNLEFKRLNKKKQNLYRMAQGFSALGLNIEVIDNSDDPNNGQFDPDANIITINLSATHYGNENVKGERQRYVVNTFAHELTHYLEYNANDAYQVLKNLVKEGLQNKFEDSASIWDKQFSYEYFNAKERIKEDAEKNNKQLSDEEISEKASAIAESEVVARACENILNNNQQMIDILSQSDVSTLQTIRNAIAKFFEKFRSMVQKLMGGFESQMKEAQAVKEIDGLLEKMQKAWADAFTQAIGKAQITDKMEESAGIKVDSETGTIVSDLNSEKRSLAKEWQNMKHKVNGKNVNYESYEECIDDVARTIAEKSHQDYEKVKDWIKAEESISAMIMREEYAEFLDYEADDRFQPIKKNSDYPQGTFDLSNLCRKREIFTKMFDALQRRNAKVLFDADDLAAIRQVLAEEHYEVACALCYVEDRRQKMGEIAQAFIGYYQDALKSKDKLIFKINSEGESVALKPSKDQRDKYHLPDAQYKATDKYIPTQYDLVTYEGFKALQEEHPTIAYAFERYNNSRGMASARVIEGHAEYARQVLGYTKNQIAKINSLGGLRVFSFSDFQAMHLIDVVQIINDCAKMGIKMQAYTKVPEFAELVRNTKMKINRSLIPANVGSKKAYARVIENGNVKYVKVKPYKNGIAKYKGQKVLAYDIVEGIDITSKHFLDETTSANVGNILVGCNDEQIKLAMLDPFVDYIIPFHTGQRLSVLHTKGIDKWDNYRDFQEDRQIGNKEETNTEGKKKKKVKGVNIYDLVKNGRVTNKYEFFDAFIAAANGKDLIPRFDNFIDKDEKGNYVYTEGYWKMLLDFKMFDAEGNILPQETVVPVHFEEEGHLDALVKEIFDKDVAREKDMRFDDKIEQTIKDALAPKHGVLKSAKRSNGTYEKKAIEHFGTTENFNVAGYILNDGQMLDFSGAHWLEGYDDAYIRNWKSKNDIRQVDHEDIYEVMEKSGDNRKQFMDRGNIRISPEAPGINISTKAEPTAAQYARIKEFVNSIKDGNRFYLDIEDTKPNKVTYNGKISADRVVNDIRTFFETGVMPKGSEGSLSEYLYSDKRDSNGNNLTVAQEEFFKDSKARDSKGNLLVLYHGTTDGGFNTFNNADGIGYWFTDNVSVASTYSDAYDRDIYAPSNSLQDFIDYDVYPNVNYKCYLNITNPYIIDAKGRAWNDLPSNNSKSLKMIVDVISNTALKFKFDGKTKSIGFDWDEFEGYMKSLGFDDDRIAHMYDVLGNVEFGQSHTFDIDSKEGKLNNFTTRDYEKYAYDNGYDGLIVNNVIDPGFAADESDKNVVSNVYVAFNPNQIKSVNNQNPTSNPDIRYSTKRGYHAGDLGKSESLAQQGYGRDTGHFGTGTYFVSDPKAIEGYNSRNGEKAPIETVDFSKYNLYKVSTDRQGYRLHDFLRFVDGYYNINDYEIRNEEDWERRKDDLDYAISENSISKEDAFKEALNLFGEYEVGRRVNENSDVPENMWINYQDGEFYMIDQSDNYKDVPITYEQAIDYIRMDDLVYSLISDNRYAPKFVDRIERFTEFISEYSDELFGLSEEEVYEMLDDISEEIKNLKTNGKTDDSAATRFMKRLGYEGIDVGGTGLDNTMYGSVIYDLKGEDLARKQEIGTARFSEKRTVEQKLQAENEKLKADVKNLRDLVKLQNKETHGYIPSKSTIEAAAKSILNGSKSTYNRANLEKELAAVWTKLAKGASINSLYDDIKAMADNVANDIRDQVEVDKTYKRMLNDIRKTHVSFTDRQLQYAKDRYGSPSKNYNDYRNAFMGKVILDKNAEALDTMWQRWMQVYPDVFDEMSEEDMVDGLLDAYANIKDAAQYVVDLDYEYASNEIAQTITEKLWNISAYQTVADKYADKIKQMRAEHREEMKNLSKSRIEANQKLADDMYYSKVIGKIKADRDAKINAINEMYKQRKTSEREKNAKNKLISHIEKNCIKLTNWINGRDKNHHVVVELLEPVQALLDSLDFASNRMLGITPNGQESFGANKGKPTRRDVSIIKAMEKMRRAVEDSLKAQEDVATTFAFPEDMLDTLDEIKDYMERIQEQVADDAKSNNLMYQNALIVRMLDIPRLQMVDEVVSIMTGVVTQADKLVASRNAHSVDYIAQKIMKDADARNARFKAGNRFVDGIDTFLNSDNITPYYFFKHLGEGGMDIFTEIMDGWDAYAFKNKAINDFIDSVWDEFKDESYTKWRDDIQDIEIEEMPTKEEAANGAVAKTITLHMNIPQIMSFYCLNKREQARSHIYQKGIKIANIEGRNSSGVQVATITQDAADKIIAVLNKPEYKNAKIVADRLQKFMSEECAKWGNEITYKRFGIMGFTEENYFPIQVDNNAINKEPKEGDAASIYRLLNMSFTKRLTENASNKLVISDIFDVFTNHASDMAKYNTLALPTLDLIKVLNYKEVSRTEGSQREEVGTRQSLERAFDTRSIKYIYRFLEDLNGSQVKEDGMILKTLLRNAKIAAVGANFQVALLQPMSYIRAAYNLDPAYLARALRRRPQIHKVKEECGVSCWKDQGYYDVNTNTGLVHKIKRDNGVIEKIREGSMIGAQHLDDVTWGYLYNACEEWANDNVSYSHDSKEYRQAVNDKFRELAYETQVFDSTVSRSQAMRNKGYGWQIATSFGSEPTLGLNMLYDAVNGFATDIRKGATTGQALRNNRNKMLRAFTVFATGAILESALRAAIAKLRKPDDDEEYWKLLLQHLIDELNPFTKVPIIKDFISFLEGYSVSRLEYGGLDNAAQAIRGFAKSFSNGEPPTWKSVSKMFQAFSQLAGIPITGVMRDGLTIWNNIVKLLGYDSLIVKM